MNKADLVDKIAGACEISKAQATTAIDTAVDSITSALRKGDRVALIGFGTFSVSAAKGTERAQPANRRHYQNRCPQSREVQPWGRTQKVREQEVVRN